MIFDPEMIRRIESSAARTSMATAAAFVERQPDDPARAVVLGGGAAVALGPGRYVNRAIGASLDELDDDDLHELETFSASAGVAASLEVASWAPAALVQRLGRRGYILDWFRNVYIAELDERPAIDHPAMTIADVDGATLGEWLGVLREGNSMTSPDDATVSDEFALASHAVAGSTDFLAHVDGIAAGCGSLVRESGIGWLGGAATTPAFRRRGVQGALVRRRMAVAAASGCDLAVVTAMPAGDSARNLARLGFTLAYCQAVMTRPSA